MIVKILILRNAFNLHVFKEVLLLMSSATRRIYSMRKKDVPYTVKYISIRKYTDIKVGSENRVEGTNLLVPEESVRHPNFTGISESKVADAL